MGYGIYDLFEDCRATGLEGFVEKLVEASKVHEQMVNVLLEYLITKVHYDCNKSEAYERILSDCQEYESDTNFILIKRGKSVEISGELPDGYKLIYKPQKE